MTLTDEERSTLTEQIVLAWSMAYEDRATGKTHNQWQRFADLIREAPEPEALFEVCREILFDLLPFSISEQEPVKEDGNGQYWYDFEGERTFYLWVPTNMAFSRKLTAEEVERRLQPDEYGFISYRPDETGREYGLPDNAVYCVSDLLIAYITAYGTLEKFLQIPEEISLQNGAFSHIYALANQNIDPKTAERILIQQGNARRRTPQIEGIELKTKAKPIPPNGMELQNIFIITADSAREELSRLKRDNALAPSRDHLWQYICALYNNNKPTELTLTEFIKVFGLDPNNRNKAKDKLISILFDLMATTMAFKDPEGYTKYRPLIVFDEPPEGQEEKKYRIFLPQETKEMLDIEASTRGKEKVPMPYFTIDDRHRTANALASAFLQDESRNATRSIDPLPWRNPTTRNAQALMNEIYPRTKGNRKYSRMQTQAKKLYRDIDYLTSEVPVFETFNFIQGKRLLTWQQARQTLAKWKDYESVYIEAVSTNPDRYQEKKKKFEENRQKEAEREAKKREREAGKK